MKQASRPRQRKSETWAGTRRPVNLPTDPPENLEAQIWVEMGTGQVRVCEIVPTDTDLTDFSQSLWRAVTEPAGQAKSYRPGRVVVDRPELLQSILPLAKMQGIETELDPEAGEMFTELLQNLEEQLADGPGFHFLADEDVDPGLVSILYEKSFEFFQQAPWEWLSDADWIEIDGIAPEPLYGFVMGASGEIGLALCWSREAAERFAVGDIETGEDVPSLALMVQTPEELQPGLEMEIAKYSWKTHPLGAAILLRADRPDRPHPTEDELRLMTRAVEAVTLYLADRPEDEGQVQLSTGETAKVRFVDDLAPDMEFEDIEQLLELLDELAAKGELERALTLAATAFEESPFLEPPLLYRLSAYSFRLEMFSELEDLWQNFSDDCDAEWHYVGALTALARAQMPTFRKRLKKAQSLDSKIGTRLVARSSQSDTDFLTLWRPLWKGIPEAVKALKEPAPEKSSAKPKSSKPKKAKKG